MVALRKFDDRKEVASVDDRKDRRIPHDRAMQLLETIMRDRDEVFRELAK